jgi:hypothetical protein
MNESSQIVTLVAYPRERFPNCKLAGGPILFVIVFTVMTLSLTVFAGGRVSASSKQNGRNQGAPLYDRTDRFPVVEEDETDPIDPTKKAKLKKQKERYDHDAPFSNPGPTNEELSFRPEWQFNFPALPVAQSDVVVTGQMLDAEAHRSNNRMNVFSNLQMRVDRVLKGNLVAGAVITVQRIGGFVKYPNGRKVLFRLSGTGMPAVGARYALFLNIVDEDYSILTGYELAPEGVLPLDMSKHFDVYQGQSETNFLQALNDACLKTILKRGAQRPRLRVNRDCKL